MAYVDGKLLYSDAQALSVTAVSTNVVDHVNDSKIGMGEPMIIDIAVEADTVGAGSYLVELETSVDEAFTTPIVVASGSIPTGTLEGARLYVDVPPTSVFERYTRLNYTLSGALTATVTSDLKAKSMIDASYYYDSGFTVAP